MAKKKPNRYTKKAKKKNLMHHISNKLETKGNVKNTMLETGKDLIVGVIGGGLVGAVIGRASLGAGAVVTGAGHYAGNNLATIFGIGMMASNGFQKSKAVSGLDGLEGIKERVQAYKETFSEKLFLDKLIVKKGIAANGIGDVQYFTYPNEMNQNPALDYIENQITESGLQQMQATGESYGGDLLNPETEEIII